MNLKLPDPGALLYSRHLKQYMRTDAPLKGRVKVCSEIRCKNDNPIEPLQLAQQNIDGQVALAVVG